MVSSPCGILQVLISDALGPGGGPFVRRWGWMREKQQNIRLGKEETCGMAKYFLKRIAYGVVTLFVLVSLTF